MRWDAGSMGGHKNKSKRPKNDCAGYIFGHMAGEISPDITFFRVWRIWVLMGVGEHIWVLLDALGSRDTGGTKNNRKRSKNDRVVLIF